MASAVWAKGIVQEINARLPAPVRKSVEHDVAARTDVGHPIGFPRSRRHHLQDTCERSDPACHLQRDPGQFGCAGVPRQ